MTVEKDYAEETRKLSDEALIEQLVYCGYDSYYRELYNTTIKEIKKRLKDGRRMARKEKQDEEDAAETARA